MLAELSQVFLKTKLVFNFSLPRQTTLAVYVMSFLGMILFACTLNLGHLWVVFITAGALG